MWMYRLLRNNNFARNACWFREMLVQKVSFNEMDLIYKTVQNTNINIDRTQTIILLYSSYIFNYTQAILHYCVQYNK